MCLVLGSFSFVTVVGTYTLFDLISLVLVGFLFFVLSGVYS